MCNTPNKPASDEAPTRFAVGDSIALNLRVVREERGGAYWVAIEGYAPEPALSVPAAALAAGRLVATRPLAVGDSVKPLHGGGVGTLEYRYNTRGIDMGLVRWADDSIGPWCLVSLVRVSR